jgi:hypothetical protein
MTKPQVQVGNPMTQEKWEAWLAKKSVPVKLGHYTKWGKELNYDLMIVVQHSNDTGQKSLNPFRIYFGKYFSYLSLDVKEFCFGLITPYKTEVLGIVFDNSYFKNENAPITRNKASKLNYQGQSNSRDQCRKFVDLCKTIGVELKVGKMPVSKAYIECQLIPIEKNGTIDYKTCIVEITKNYVINPKISQ